MEVIRIEVLLAPGLSAGEAKGHAITWGLSQASLYHHQSKDFTAFFLTGKDKNKLKFSLLIISNSISSGSCPAPVGFEMSNAEKAGPVENSRSQAFVFCLEFQLSAFFHPFGTLSRGQ